MSRLLRERVRRERLDEQERRRLAIVESFGVGADSAFMAWLQSLSYAELVAHRNAGHLDQPALPGTTTTGREGS